MHSVFKLKNFFLMLILAAVFISCEHQPQKQKQIIVNQDVIDQRMMNANRILLENENEQIAEFTKRYLWKMNTTASGLRYMVYEKGKGLKAKINNRIKIKYKTSLLNGVTVYNSDVDGLKTFVTGKAEVESGLEEGILLLKVGDKAKFIIPSHLAFGLIGDQKKIPKKATLVYDVELLDVEKMIK